MAPFQAKIRWKRSTKERKYKLSFRSVPIRCVIENSKKIAKKFKKLKNTFRPSFHAKTCWKMQKKRENKNYCFVSFLHDAEDKIREK